MSGIEGPTWLVAVWLAPRLIQTTTTSYKAGSDGRDPV